MFCPFPQSVYGAFSNARPLASFLETKGLTLILLRENAERNGFKFERVFKRITLGIQSSLNAVGLTAAVSKSLSDKGIPANIVAAYHDPIFVPKEKAEAAMTTLRQFSAKVKI